MRDRAPAVALTRNAMHRLLPANRAGFASGRRGFAQTNSAGNAGNPPKEPKGGALATAKQGGPTALTMAQKVKETSKDAGYSVVIIVAAGVLVLAAYEVFSAFFSSTNPHNVYSKACKLIEHDPEVQKLLGPNIKFYGEETSRRRKGLHSVRYHNSSTQQEHLRVQFTVEGDTNVGDVSADVKLSSGNFYSLVIEMPVSGEKLVYTAAGKFERR